MLYCYHSGTLKHTYYSLIVSQAKYSQGLAVIPRHLRRAVPSMCARLKRPNYHSYICRLNCHSYSLLEAVLAMQHNNRAAGDSSELQLCILQGSITISLAFTPPAAKAQAGTARRHTDRPACSEHYGAHHNSPRGRGAPVTVPEPSRRTCGRNKRVP